MLPPASAGLTSTAARQSRGCAQTAPAPRPAPGPAVPRPTPGQPVASTPANVRVRHGHSTRFLLSPGTEASGPRALRSRVGGGTGQKPRSGQSTVLCSVLLPRLAGRRGSGGTPRGWAPQRAHPCQAALLGGRHRASPPRPGHDPQEASKCLEVEELRAETTAEANCPAHFNFKTQVSTALTAAFPRRTGKAASAPSL